MRSELPGGLRFLRRVTDNPHAPGVADADLLDRFVTHRDEAAFELLMWRHAGMVLHVCRAVLRDRHLAEDAFQATFLALARKAASVRRGGAVAAWLYRVARNAALRARALAARTAAGPLVAEPLAPPASPTPEADELSLLHDELDRLPEKYRAPLVLCFLEGKSHADAARALGWPKGTVAGRVARGRDLLRRRLARRAGVPLAALPVPLPGAAPGFTVRPALVAAVARASVPFAAGVAPGTVSEPVLRLTEGVLKAMFVSKLKSAALALVTALCVALGGSSLGGWALAQRTPGPGDPPPTPAVAAQPPKGKDDPRAADPKLRAQSVKHLQQIALAAHNYHDANGTLPNNVLGADKKPLLSWRVLLLPYIEQDNLYKQFKLDEPWDSEHNMKLLGQMPDVYRTGTEPKDSSRTYYQGFSHADSMFPPGRKGIRLTEVTDGTSNTILFIEAGAAVPWTKPEDVPYSPDKPLPKLGGPFGEVIHAAFGDGSVHTLKRDFDEKTLRLAITRSDGEVLDVEKLHGAPPPRDRDPGPPPGKADPEALQRERERAQAEADRAAKMAAQLQEVVAQQRRETEEARAEAVRARQQAEALRQENDRLKATLRDLAAQLNKLAPPEKGGDRPPPGDVKALAEELQRTQAELRRLRDEVERLKKGMEK